MGSEETAKEICTYLRGWEHETQITICGVASCSAVHRDYSNRFRCRWGSATAIYRTEESLSLE